MHLDLNVLRGFIGDNKVTQQRILLKFADLLKDTRGSVVDAVDKDALDAVRSACHALKSSSRSVGAIELGRLSEQLEAIGAGRAPGPIEPVLACFLEECSAVEHELAEKLSEVS
jgi:HPt (histidine-containing phosphotransfer) domain-containing protein